MTSSTQTSDFTAASHHKPKSIIKGIFLVFLWIFIGIYFLIIIVLLAVRLFFLPLVESEKSTIEEKLTELTSYQVTIGNITGSWSLFNPGVMLEDVTIGGADGIHIKSASATLSLLTFARFEPIFLQITVESPSVTAYREGPMRFIFMGQEIDLEKKEDNSNNEALWKTLNWLSHQKQIEVFDGTFKAVNQQNGESFEVTDIKATISNTALTKQAAVELSLPK